MTINRITEKILHLTQALSEQVFESTVMNISANTITVRHKGKIVESENINVTSTLQKTLTVHDINSNKYYTWTEEEENRSLNKTVIKHRKTRPYLDDVVEPQELYVLGAYLFGTVNYYDYLSATMKPDDQPLEIFTVNDSTTAISPDQINTRKVIKGTLRSGKIRIVNTLSMIYSSSVPYVEPHIEIFRAESFPMTNTITSPDGVTYRGDWDNISLDHTDMPKDFYKKYFHDTGIRYKRIGGYKYANGISTTYPNNATEYKEDSFINSSFQSVFTGIAYTQRLVDNRLEWELPASFTDDFYIVIFDRSISPISQNGEPYGGASRTDPHVEQTIRIQTYSYHLGLGGTSLPEPLQLDYYYYDNANLQNLSCTTASQDSEVYLITHKHEEVSYTEPTDSVLYFLKTLDLDLNGSLFNRWYGLDAGSMVAGESYYQIPFGRITYILVTVENGILIKKAQKTYTYPEPLLNNSLPSEFAGLEINVITNPEFIFNYIGNRGVGWHKSDSHNGTFQLIPSEKLSNPINDINRCTSIGLKSYFKSADFNVPNFFQPIDEYNQHGTYPVLLKPFAANNVSNFYLGLPEYETELNNLLATDNPSIKLNLFSKPNAYFIPEQPYGGIVPNHSDYFDFLLNTSLTEEMLSTPFTIPFVDDGNTLYYWEFYQDKQPYTEEAWELFSSEIRTWRILVPYFKIESVADLTLFNNKYISNVEDFTYPSLGWIHLKKTNLESIIDSTSDEYESFRVLLIFPYLAKQTHPNSDTSDSSYSLPNYI